MEIDNDDDINLVIDEQIKDNKKIIRGPTSYEQFH